MGSMMDDINKYSKMWDDVLKSDIFKDADQKSVGSDKPESGADFFGNYLSDDYDADRPLNESDLNNWNDVLKLAKTSVSGSDMQKNQKTANSMGKASNPIYPYSVGMDQEIEKWDLFRQRLEQLEELKKNLYNLESNLNKLTAQASQEKKNKTKKKDPIDNVQEKINKLTKEINDLSDLVTGKFGMPN